MGGICSNSNPDEIVPVNENHQIQVDMEPVLTQNSIMRGWDKTFPAMTSQELLKKRKEFWETRISGAPHMWEALNIAMAIRSNNFTDDQATRAVILETNGFTPLTFDNMEMAYCYDAKTGVKYEIPLYIVFDPRNILPDTARGGPEDKEKVEGLINQADLINVQNQNNGKTLNGLDNKSPTINFKVRFSNGMGDLPVSLSSSSNIGLLKKHIFSLRPSAPPTSQRIYYQGHVIKDSSSLENAAIKEGYILQCMVINFPSPT